MREFIGNQTDFGGTDSPLSAEEAASAKERCGGAEAWHLPAVFGSVAITFNLANVDTLALDAPTLARIFNRAREAVGPRRVGGVPAAAARPTNSPDPGRRER